MFNKVCNRGFTLIEVLASVVLIGIGVIPIARVLTQSLVISTKEERLTKAIFLAQRKTEELKSKILYDFDTRQDENVAAFSDSGYSMYKYSVADTIIEREDSDLKQIQVQVWYDHDEDNKLDDGEISITLDTKVAER